MRPALNYLSFLMYKHLHIYLHVFASLMRFIATDVHVFASPLLLIATDVHISI
jgi:hypothetical protein